MTGTRILWGIAGVGLLALGDAVGVVILSRGGPHGGPSVDETGDGKSGGEQRLKSAGSREAVRSDIVAFCGDCHALPNPASFPREDWPKEVWQGFDFYTESGRNDLRVPSVQATIDFFRSQAWKGPSIKCVWPATPYLG